MKKFLANLGLDNYYESPYIKEVEYDHFEKLSERIIIGYDGDILPDSVQRRNREIRFSLFLEDTLYDSEEEAKTYLITTLEERLKEIEEKLGPLLIKQKNIKKILSTSMISDVED